MTVLMLWREGPAQRLWLTSDSRLSHSGKGGGFVKLTDRAAKLLEADLILQCRNPNGPPIAKKTVGIAYAGSSLVALQSYAAVLPLWSRLCSSGEQTLPTIGECAEHLGQFVRAYTFELAAAGDINCRTECLLLGYNEGAESAEAWHIYARPGSTGVALNIERLELGAGEMMLFGSGRAEASRQLKKLKPTNGQWRHEPIDMLRAQLRHDTPSSVGGGVQIGMLNPSGFELVSDVRYFTAGDSAAGDSLLSMHYRGFNLEEVNKVGHCFGALAGINT